MCYHQQNHKFESRISLFLSFFLSTFNQTNKKNAIVVSISAILFSAVDSNNKRDLY